MSDEAGRRQGDGHQGVRWAEDVEVGTVVDLGAWTVSRKEILDFAEMWDPQLFHVDDAVAEAGHFGELIASGIHTLAVYQRLSVLGAYSGWAVLAGRRLRSVEFLAPVTAGTTLYGELTVTAVDLSRPGRALASTRGRLHDGKHDVLTVELEAYLRRRPAGEGPQA